MTRVFQGESKISVVLMVVFLVAAYFAQGISYKSVSLLIIMLPVFIVFHCSTLFSLLEENRSLYAPVAFFILYMLISLIWAADKTMGIKTSLGYTIGFATAACCHLIFSKALMAKKILFLLYGSELILSILEVAFEIKWPLSKYSQLCSMFTTNCLDKTNFDSFWISYWETSPTGFRFNTNNFVCVALAFYPMVFLKLSRLLRILSFVTITIVVIYSSGRIGLIAYSLLACGLVIIHPKRIWEIVFPAVLVFFLTFSFTKIGSFKLNELTSTGYFIKKAIKSDKTQVDSFKAGKTERISSSVLRGYTPKVLVNDFLPSLPAIYGMGAGQSFYIFNQNLHNFWLEIFFEFGLIGLLICAFILLHAWKKIRYSKTLILSAVVFSISVMSLSTAFYFIPIYVLLAIYISEDKKVDA